jgi:hypothetical protein
MWYVLSLVYSRTVDDCARDSDKLHVHRCWPGPWQARFCRSLGKCSSYGIMRSLHPRTSASFSGLGTYGPLRRLAFYMRRSQCGSQFPLYLLLAVCFFVANLLHAAQLLRGWMSAATLMSILPWYWCVGRGLNVATMNCLNGKISAGEKKKS